VCQEFGNTLEPAPHAVARSAAALATFLPQGCILRAVVRALAPCTSTAQLAEHALRKRTVAGSIRIRGLASLFLNGLLDKGTHSWPGIDSHLEVPVYGALAEHCEVSVLRARALPVRVHLGMDCAISL
jgi:hypothetical protein